MASPAPAERIEWRRDPGGSHPCPRSRPPGRRSAGAGSPAPERGRHRAFSEEHSVGPVTSPAGRRRYEAHAPFVVPIAPGAVRFSDSAKCRARRGDPDLGISGPTAVVQTRFPTPTRSQRGNDPRHPSRGRSAANCRRRRAPLHGTPVGTARRCPRGGAGRRQLRHARSSDRRPRRPGSASPSSASRATVLVSRVPHTTPSPAQPETGVPPDDGVADRLYPEKRTGHGFRASAVRASETRSSGSEAARSIHTVAVSTSTG